MTLAQVRDAVDARLPELWQRIRDRQLAYYANRGRYWQGLWSHSIPPNTLTASLDLVETAPDTAAQKPTNESEAWATIPQFPALLGYRLRCDVYTAAQGDGFAARIQVRYNGRLFERAQAYGPAAAQFTHPWAELVQR